MNSSAISMMMAGLAMGFATASRAQYDSTPLPLPLPTAAPPASPRPRQATG